MHSEVCWKVCVFFSAYSIKHTHLVHQVRMIRSLRRKNWWLSSWLKRVKRKENRSKDLGFSNQCREGKNLESSTKNLKRSNLKGISACHNSSMNFHDLRKNNMTKHITKWRRPIPGKERMAIWGKTCPYSVNTTEWHCVFCVILYKLILVLLSSFIMFYVLFSL